MPAASEIYVSSTLTPVLSARRAWFAWGATAAVVLPVVGLTLIAPWAEARGFGSLAAGLYQAFGHVCHQLPERSFYLLAHPFAVCARCFGLYAGFALGVALYPLAREITGRETPARKWLFSALVPVGIDFALGFVGLWENTHLSRAATGALLGAVVAFYVVPGLVDASQTDWRQALRARPAAQDGRGAS